jgi:endonuclease/exonuclease/phosphatase family metal-dependent hydrolase
MQPGILANRCVGALSLCAVLAACGATREPAPVSPDTATCRRTLAAGHSVTAAPLRWLVPREPRRRAELDAWCATVGPAVVAAAPSSVPRRPVDSLVLISWNVHLGGGDIDSLVADLRAGRLTGGEPVEAFVLLLQEAHRAGPMVPRAEPGAPHIPRRQTPRQSDGGRPDIVETARRLELAFLYVPSMHNGVPPRDEPEEDRGNAILSTLPLEELAAIELPVEAQRRVAAAVTVGGLTGAGRRWRLRLVDVHLDNRSPGWPFSADSRGGGRLRQMQALLRLEPPEGPTVLAGDFNTWAGRGFEPVLGFLEAAPRFNNQPLPWYLPTYRAFSVGRQEVGAQLDHVFWRLPADWALRYRRLADRYHSDHYPLLVWVRPGPVAP